MVSTLEQMQVPKGLYMSTCTKSIEIDLVFVRFFSRNNLFLCDLTRKIYKISRIFLVLMAGVSNLSHWRTFVRQTGQNVRQGIFKYDPF